MPPAKLNEPVTAIRDEFRRKPTVQLHLCHLRPSATFFDQRRPPPHPRSLKARLQTVHEPHLSLDDVSKDRWGGNHCSLACFLRYLRRPHRSGRDLRGVSNKCHKITRKYYICTISAQLQ